MLTISDTSISDTNGSNNTFTHTGIVRGSPYPICINSSMAIPQDECEALMDLYVTTNGSSWANKTNR